MNWRRYANSVFVLKVLGVYGALVTCAVTLPASGNRRQRAVLGMAWGLILLWIVVGGILTRVYRRRTRDLVLPVRLGWRVFCAGVKNLLRLTVDNFPSIAPRTGSFDRTQGRGFRGNDR